jgi:hypothetical protein
MQDITMHNSQRKHKHNSKFVFVTLNLWKRGYIILKYLSTLSAKSVENEIGANKFRNNLLRNVVKQSALFSSSLPTSMADVEVANIPIARSFADNIMTRKHEGFFLRFSDFE